MMTSVKAARLIPLNIHSDSRGDLFAVQEEASFPFKPVRIFVLRNLDCKSDRACHAVSCDEFLVPLTGCCKLEVRSLSDQKIFGVDDLDMGVYVPAGLWMRLSDFSEGFIAMVVCSKRFEDTVYFQTPQV